MEIPGEGHDGLPEARHVWEARKRIAPYILRTPLVFSQHLSELLGAEIYLKLENLQEIGAFKIRGAANRILSLSDDERKRGVTTYSTGNHAQAVACMARRLGIQASVFVSDRVPEAKLEAIRRWGADVRIAGTSQDEAETYCRELAGRDGMTVVDPFDDPFVIAGQGTIGLEILEDLPGVDTVVVPTSGGGLISGVALAVKANSPGARVTGVSMEKGAVMYESLKAGKPVALEESDTLADSLLGGIGLENRYTFPLVRRLVDGIALVPEKEIARGMAFLLRKHKIAVEGAAATGPGALLSGIVPPGARTAVVITGCNVSADSFLETVNAVRDF